MNKYLTIFKAWSWPKQAGAILVPLLIMYWLFFTGKDSQCTALANTSWELIVDDKKQDKALFIVNNVVPYANYPGIARLIGVVQVGDKSKSFNHAQCFKQDGKLQIQTIPLPRHFGLATNFTSEYFYASDPEIKVNLYHNDPKEMDVNDYSGILKRVTDN